MPSQLSDGSGFSGWMDDWIAGMSPLMAPIQNQFNRPDRSPVYDIDVVDFAVHETASPGRIIVLRRPRGTESRDSRMKGFRVK